MNGLRIMFVQASIAYKLSNVIIQSAACPGEVLFVQLFLKGSFQLLYRLLKP